MNERNKALDYANENNAQFLKTLKDFIRIPSISTDPDKKPEMLKAANWVSEKLNEIGMDNIQIFPTAGHPVVYADCESSKPGAPTVLIYGHYDVQPADPYELWESQPFEPTIRGDYLFARGASDMKGQVSASLFAVEAIIKNSNSPVNLKFMIEGEEEIGSPNLTTFIETHKDILTCDIALNPDTGMIAADIPTITYALRGMAYFEIRVSGPAHDLHSGLYGGIIHNPAQVLCELIAGMHDNMGRITLPGYYDRVRALTQEERVSLAKLPMTEKYYLDQTGVPALYGEEGFTPIELIGARPTLDVNGFYSGFIGEGSKTIIPAWAMAKVSMRLVPDQDPNEVSEQLLAYIVDNIPPTVHCEVKNMPFGPPSISDISHPGTQAMAKALTTVWGKEPVFKREGGSVPVVANMQRILGVESILTGFGLSDDNIHAPNEKLHLPTWYRGIESFIHFFYNYGESVN
jgi:acetylornithine deacetylase/succinyl-diaminopimelate desuccinylase-like protein